MIEKLSRMPNPTRTDLEEAARRYFSVLEKEVFQPRDFHPIFGDEQVSESIEWFQQRIDDLDAQLRSGTFDKAVEAGSIELSEHGKFELDELPDELRRYAVFLSARVAREHSDRMARFLQNPAKQFEHQDALFAAPPMMVVERRSDTFALPTGPTIADVAQVYLDRKIAQGVGQSQRTELARALGWLSERVGRDIPLTSVPKPALRQFRDDLRRVDGTLQGRKLPFDQRLTNDPAKKLKSVTARRYWTSVYSFFEWAAAEGFIPVNPAEGLKLELNKSETRDSPEPFSVAELKKLFATPLYAGYQSPSRPRLPGQCHIRDGRWWSGIIFLFTGLRAGELAQLLPADFVFDAEFPHIKVRLDDGTGAKVKSAKNQNAIRDVPIAKAMLDLGLRQFVERRATKSKSGRVFSEFRLGVNGRKSDGAGRFWGPYLQGAGLWKPGRATHVWRHSLVAFLRLNEVPQEDIAALVGHSQGTMTAGYGGGYPLSRKAKTLSRLDFGFDVVAAAGGPYDSKTHG